MRAPGIYFPFLGHILLAILHSYRSTLDWPLTLENFHPYPWPCERASEVNVAILLFLGIVSLAELVYPFFSFRPFEHLLPPFHGKGHLQGLIYIKSIFHGH